MWVFCSSRKGGVISGLRTRVSLSDPCRSMGRIDETSINAGAVSIVSSRGGQFGFGARQWRQMQLCVPVLSGGAHFWLGGGSLRGKVWFGSGRRGAQVRMQGGSFRDYGGTISGRWNAARTRGVGILRGGRERQEAYSGAIPDPDRLCGGCWSSRVIVKGGPFRVWGSGRRGLERNASDFRFPRFRFGNKCPDSQIGRVRNGTLLMSGDAADDLTQRGCLRCRRGRLCFPRGGHFGFGAAHS